MSDQRRLLGVFAHPDDESYGPGGTIARYLLEGAEVYLLIFTCGEAGTIGVSGIIPRDELCRLRTAELDRACRALGTTAHRVLGVPDGKVGEADESWAVGQIIDYIKKYRPEVLITFHHRGISGHPDHVAVAGFVAKAFDAVAGDPGGPQKLYEYGIHERQGRFRRGRKLYPLTEDEIDAEIVIPDEAMERKLEAIRQHQTQYEFFMSLTNSFDYESVTRPEYFYLRKSRLPRPESRETDLFAGIPGSERPA